VSTPLDATPALGPSPAGDLLLDVRNLTVDFPTDDGPVHAVRGVSYALRPGEVLGIVGESGSGKSVTSLAILGLLPRTARIEGSVTFRGEELLGRSDNEMTKIRGNKIAMIFQDPMTSLNPVYSIGWQLAEAVRAHRDVSQHEALDRAVELLALVGIPRPKERAASYPHEFSGGMRQRVVIALAMANDPDVIIADEPTTALDVTVQAQILETLRKAQAETSAAIVLITHDLGVVAGMADRVLVMYAGKPVEIGDVDDLYYQPRMPYTIGLLGSLPRLDAVDQDRLTPIAGSPPSLINLPPGCPFSPRCPLREPICETEEPALRKTDGLNHFAACHFSDTLSADDVVAETLFSATSADVADPISKMAVTDASGTVRPAEIAGRSGGAHPATGPASPGETDQ
jgi:oligopeptide/dipeptide ABC transporter ATP-binding protein